MASPTTPRSRRIPMLARVWLFTAAMAAASVAVLVFGLLGAEAVSPDASISFWWIVIGFIATETYVVHLHFRSESGTFSFFEIALILGLLFTSPSLLWLAVALSSFVALRFVRRQPWIKIAFNLGNQTLHVGLAAVLLWWLLGDTPPLDPKGWLIITAVAVITGALEMAAIVAVISITEERVEWGRARNTIGFGVVVSATNATQALVAALLLVTEPLSLALLGVTTLVLFVSYRAYFSERDHRERVEFLYNSTRTLRENTEMDGAIGSLLTEAAAMFRASGAELILFPAPDTDQTTRYYRLSNGETTAEGASAGREEAARVVAEEATDPLLVTGGEGPAAVVDYLSRRQYGDSLIGTLRSDQRAVAVLLVEGRLGNVSSFTQDDLRLFETLVEQSAIALENDQLEQTLSQLRRLERKLAHQANHDALTGLANRSLLTETLERAVDAGDPVALLYIDLDDFKVVNDTMGHAAGDRLLCQAAERITNCIRPGDVAARLGGDEFAVMLTQSDGAEVVGHRILADLQRPYDVDGTEARVGVSVGLADDQEPIDAASRLGQADAAMYVAKQRGKGTLARFEPQMYDELFRNQWLRADLRKAIDRGEFEIHYQPMVDLGTMRVVGAEALVRWLTPDGLVMPSRFIQEAERAGLILPIDRLVLETALADLERLQGKVSQLFFSTNLSARHFQEADFVQQLANIFRETAVDASTIVLEITETALVHDAESATTQLDEIRQLGPRIALDDFGTGYSSLSHLRRLPVDMLKIAQPFVADLATEAGETFVDAIVGLGHTLGLEVLAEGIEEPSQLEKLRSLGCDLGQGFLLARPVPIDEFERLADALIELPAT